MNDPEPRTATSALPERLAVITPLLREVADQKRVRVAHAEGSMAERAFSRAWAALVDGADPAVVADAEARAAVLGARLAGIDDAVLHRAGLTDEQAARVADHAFEETVGISGALHPDALGRLRVSGPPSVPSADPPRFVDDLRRQPRAGATAPGKPRLTLEPPENHAEHCWAVAVFGTLLADDVSADPADAFLLGLAHHLHNAVLPDAGFAGEVMLAEQLEPVVERLTEAELATLPGPLAERLRALLALRADADTPLGGVFHAADVLDRALQIHHHASAAAFTARDALVDLELVHDSPVADYQHAVLAAAGLDAT